MSVELERCSKCNRIRPFANPSCMTGGYCNWIIDIEPSTTPATPDALSGQVRATIAIMQKLTPEARAALAQANVNHLLSLKAWKDGAIDDSTYLRAADEYANVMLAIEANGV